MPGQLKLIMKIGLLPWVPGVVVVQIALIQDPSSDLAPYPEAVRITMSRYTSAQAVFLGAAVVALAGCGSAAGTSSAASSSSPAGAASSATATTSATTPATPTASPGSVVAAGSIP